MGHNPRPLKCTMANNLRVYKWMLQGYWGVWVCAISMKLEYSSIFLLKLYKFEFKPYDTELYEKKNPSGMHFISFQLMTKIQDFNYSTNWCLPVMSTNAFLHFLSLYTRKRQMLSVDVSGAWAPVVTLRAISKWKWVPICAETTTCLLALFFKHRLQVSNSFPN